LIPVRCNLCCSNYLPQDRIDNAHATHIDRTRTKMCQDRCQLPPLQQRP
jgi:hypothetical protein